MGCIEQTKAERPLHSRVRPSGIDMALFAGKLYDRGAGCDSEPLPTMVRKARIAAIVALGDGEWHGVRMANTVDAYRNWRYSPLDGHSGDEKLTVDCWTWTRRLESFSPVKREILTS